ncbi:hypothetical protein DGWBC_0578 [Dehalogenimonas sp. WBC-2]|nr:hypothetical protein DGWBC_0578 [Dehalogenimonas sp. WBC-2]
MKWVRKRGIVTNKKPRKVSFILLVALLCVTNACTVTTPTPSPIKQPISEAQALAVANLAMPASVLANAGFVAPSIDHGTYWVIRVNLRSPVTKADLLWPDGPEVTFENHGLLPKDTFQILLINVDRQTSQIISKLASDSVFLGPPSGTLSPELNTAPFELVSLIAVAPEIPAGPVLSLTLKNVSGETVTYLNAKIEQPGVGLPSPWIFDFTAISYPVLPDQVICVKTILIGGSWKIGIPYYPLTIAGCTQSGAFFYTTIPFVPIHFGDMLDPDDLIGTPGGWAYRANITQQGVVNLWPPVQTVNANIGTSANPVAVNYRNLIETQAGTTRNIIFTVVLPNVSSSQPGNPIEAAISANDTPQGILVVQDPGPGWHDGDPQRRVEEIVYVQIADTVKPGTYTFSFTVSIAGVQQGTLPCTVQVFTGATS